MEKFDFHSHTTFSHGKHSPEAMVAAAKAAGITILGLAEHLPRLDNFRYSSEKDLKNPRGFETWGDYLRKVDKLRRRSRKQEMKVLLGCEVDWMGEDNKDYCAEKIKEGGFDYTIGSVHFLSGRKNGNKDKKIGFDSKEDWEEVLREFGWDVEEIYRAYFAEYALMVQSSLFNIAGHFDLIKIFKVEYPLRNGDMLLLAKPALDALQKSKMVMEINSAGFEKGLGEFYPSEEILREAYKRGIPITFGSDAHSTERVGEGFGEAVKLAKKVGYTEMVVFGEKGERRNVKI